MQDALMAVTVCFLVRRSESPGPGSRSLLSPLSWPGIMSDHPAGGGNTGLREFLCSRRTGSPLRKQAVAQVPANRRAMKVDGSVALVTGANRGLGRACARELVGRGAAKVYGRCREGQLSRPEDS